MTANQSLLLLAKEGDPEAIAGLINRSLATKGATARVRASGSLLSIVVEGSELPEQKAVSNFIRQGMLKLAPQAISKVVIQGCIIGRQEVVWRETFVLRDDQFSIEHKQSREFLSRTKINTLPQEGKNLTKGHQIKKTNENNSEQNSKLDKFRLYCHSIAIKFIKFSKTRSGERILLIVGTFVVTSLLWSGIAKTEKNQFLGGIITNSPNKIIEKPLPVLGSVGVQSRFDVEDGLAVLNGTPRPTYPPTLAVLAGNPPPGTDVCNLPYSAITQAIYEKCIHEGMTYIQVSNIIGFAGEEVSQSGSTKVYRWGDSKNGFMIGTFQNDRLISKSQSTLK